MAKNRRVNHHSSKRCELISSGCMRVGHATSSGKRMPFLRSAPRIGRRSWASNHPKNWTLEDQRGEGGLHTPKVAEPIERREDSLRACALKQATTVRIIIRPCPLCQGGEEEALFSFCSRGEPEDKDDIQPIREDPLDKDILAGGVREEDRHGKA